MMSLWVVGLLGLLAWNLASRARLNIALANYRGLSLEAELLGRSSMARGLWLIRNDLQTQVDHLGEAWAIPEELALPSGSENGGRKQGEVEVGIYVKDELSKVNINLVDRETLAEILDRYYGFDIEADSVAEAITDWIDTDDNGNYELSAYDRNAKAAGPRNAAMPVIEELMDIEGMTPWLFFGEDADADGTLDPEEDDGDRNLPQDNADSILQPGLRDLFTVEGEGTMNINTIPRRLLEPVLASIVGRDEAADLAESIDARRFGPDGIARTADDSPFTSRDEISEVFGADAWRMVEASEFDFEVATTVFGIGVHVRMSEDGVVYSARGLVERSDDGETKLLLWVSD